MTETPRQQPPTPANPTRDARRAQALRQNLARRKAAPAAKSAEPPAEDEVMTVIRCPWPKDDALYCAYHDEEWGVPVYDPKALWGKLVLDGFQAGLSWITILRKREAFLEAFAGFDPEVVARFTDADRARLLANPGIIRSAAKIDAAIKGARLYLDLQDAGTNFSQLLWDHVDGRPIQNRFAASCEVPTQTAQSEALSKRLKAHGFSFVGPVIVYAFMEAVGMVNDHLVICHRHAEIAKLG